MLAQKNKVFEETCETVYKLNQNKEVRYWCEMREEGHRIQRTYESLIKQRDEKLAAQDEKLKKQDKTLAEKNKTLAEKDKTLAEKDKTLAKKDEALAEKDAKLAQSAAIIAELQEKLKAQQRI